MMMYFQELKNLKIYLSELQTLKEYELKTMNSAVDSLDFWLISRSLHARNRLNPLQFASDTGLSWDISTELFELLEEKKVFIRFYELWSEDGMECLIRTDNVENITSKETFYNSMTDEYEVVNSEFIDIWYKLLVNPQESLKSREMQEKKVNAPTFSPSNTIENPEVSEMLNKIITRKGRSK